MVLVEQNIFTKEDLETILGLPEVIASKGTIDKQTSGSVYFSAALGTSLKQTLYERIGLNLSEVAAVPMRWIKGDIPAHEDKGAGHFENTYLVYLTDSAGELLVDGNAYPISQGSAYVFSEGLRHETVGTGSEPRLLLGPMSESGVAVGGGSVINRDGQTDTIYFKYISGSGLFYRINSGDDNSVSLPITITNTNTSHTLKVLFETDITLFSNISYFICGSSHIQFGSSSLNADGSRPIITIDGALNYPGLIQNGYSGGNSHSNIYVYNLVVNDNSSTLSDGGGWIGQEYFGKDATDNYIINCSSTGSISYRGGGIVGQSSGAGINSTLYIIGCSSTGNIGQEAGGIVGYYAAEQSGSITCSLCWSEGIIGQEAGGIFGGYAGPNGTVIAENCYSMNTITSDGGGIFGSYSGEGLGNASANKCYSRGQIQTGAGGIFGRYAGYNFGNSFATNCYSTGAIATSGNGIYGSNKVNGTEPNCYAAGGSWSNMTANTVLQGAPSPIIGTTWVYRGINQPYELVSIGYTPYSVSNITSTPSLNQSYSQTVNVGDSTIGAIISGLSYQILQINGGDGSITINPTTGSISTAARTIPATYIMYIRNTGSYHITTFTLTVEEAAAAAAALTCCQRPIYIPNADYTARVNVAAGQVINANKLYRRGPLSYSDIMRINMALASKR